MEQHRFGSTQREVAAIGQGTWYIDNGDRASAIAALRQGLDLGMTHIDTAQMYGSAEEVVAEAIAGRRDRVFLVSKVLPGNASRRGTIVACEKSLARLHTDRLDSYSTSGYYEAQFYPHPFPILTFAIVCVPHSRRKCCICCTGAVNTHWRRRSLPSSNFSTRGRFFAGA